MEDDETPSTPTDAAPGNGSADGPGEGPPIISPPAATPGPAPRPRRERFVISQRLAPYGDQPTLRRDMVDLFSMRLERSVMPSADVVSDSGSAAVSGRRVVVLDADPAELAAKRSELTADAVIEPEKPRLPCAIGAALQFGTGAQPPASPGTGSELALRLEGLDGVPVKSAAVVVLFRGRQDATLQTSTYGTSDDTGRVAVSYDPNTWLASLAAIMPRDSYWATPVIAPQNGLTIQLSALPRTGPFAWWQLLSGAPTYDPAAGQGISVGVIDTGVGPHPYLNHVLPIGAFIDGAFIDGAEAARDVSNHGTHVTGLIGARPAPDSGQFGGLAPGADIRVARVFAPDRSANQGDVANAVAVLSSMYDADLVNLSLAGDYSEIERDAIIVARNSGTLCIGSAGNGGGAPVSFPAAYPECAAVSALGLVATFPPGSTAASYVPADRGRATATGLFLASFSNIGLNLACTAPGSAVISTVPATADDPSPYAEMSGTSMASPLAVGALAASLARDPLYRALPRTADRAAYAAGKLLGRALPVGLSPVYEGRGLARAG